MQKLIKSVYSRVIEIHLKKRAISLQAYEAVLVDVEELTSHVDSLVSAGFVTAHEVQPAVREEPAPEHLSEPPAAPTVQ